MEEIRRDAKSGANLLLQCRRKLPVNTFFTDKLKSGNLEAWENVKNSYEDLIRLNNEVIAFSIEKLNEYCLVKGKEHKDPKVRGLITQLAEYDMGLQTSVNAMATRIIGIASRAIIRSSSVNLWSQITTKFIPGLMRLSDNRQSTPIIQAVQPIWSKLGTYPCPEDPVMWDWENLRNSLVVADRELSKYSTGIPDDDNLIAKVDFPTKGALSGKMRMSGMKFWLEDYGASLDVIQENIERLPVLPDNDGDLLKLEGEH